MSDKTGTFDSAKLAGGLNMVFRGYAMIFDAMAEQAEPKEQMTKQEFLYTIQSKVTDPTSRIPADKVKALLNKHGASSLSALPPEKYEAFLHDFNRL